MGKRIEFTRNAIEVCRNCKSEGKVTIDTPFPEPAEVICPICGGSGLVRKHIEGFVSIEPFTKSTNP